MKKAISVSAILFVLVMALAQYVFSAGSCTVGDVLWDGKLGRQDIEWVSDASGDVDVSDGSCSVWITGQLRCADFLSESTLSPSNDYDVTLNDSALNDILFGAGANIQSFDTGDDDAANWYTSPINDAGGYHDWVTEQFELIVENAGNAKKGTVRLKYRRYY